MFFNKPISQLFELVLNHINPLRPKNSTRASLRKFPMWPRIVSAWTWKTGLVRFGGPVMPYVVMVRFGFPSMVLFDTFFVGISGTEIEISVISSSQYLGKYAFFFCSSL